MWRGSRKYRSTYTLWLPNAALASARAASKACASSSSLFTTRIPRPHDVRDVAVAERRIGRSDAQVLVREPHVQGVLVHFGMNGHAADAQFLAGPDDPHRDLAAVGHEDFLKHPSALRLGARLDQ